MHFSHRMNIKKRPPPGSKGKDKVKSSMARNLLDIQVDSCQAESSMARNLLDRNPSIESTIPGNVGSIINYLH